MRAIFWRGTKILRGASERHTMEGLGRDRGPLHDFRLAGRTVRILVIEDNPDLASSIQRGLKEHCYSVDVAHSGYEAEELATSEPYDLIVMDLMLPDRDGVELTQTLRRRGVSTLILMLTALSGTSDKVAGLEAGADDYLTKPFQFEELVARIRALLRRGQAVEPTKLEFEDVMLDMLSRRVYRAGDRIQVSSKEFALLEFFMRNPDRVLDRTTISQKVWDINHEPASNVIDVYVSALRKKIDKQYERRLIHTVVGMGYRFGSADEEASPRATTSVS